MSALRLRYVQTSMRRRPAFIRPVLARRSFQSCSILAAGKESKLHNEDRANEAEAAKQDSIKKAKEGRGEWKDTLATDSESDVKADRNDYKDAKDSIQELQKKTAEEAEKESKGQ